MVDSHRKALVLGASGGIGGEVARQLRDAGWTVVALKRGLGAAEVFRNGILWKDGDALRAQDVAAAAAGCSVIVHAVNPPGYRDWGRLVLPMLDNTIAAARAQRATIVLPGTVYNYGPGAFPLVGEDAPQHPQTRKGAIRVAMEQRLQQAAASGDVQVLIVRAGDFFGPQVGNSWFSQGMVRPGRPVRAVRLPGAGIGHQWAYLPDVAQAMLRGLERRASLPAFNRWHMAGHWDADGRALGQAVQRAVVRAGGAEPPLRAFPWWQVRLAAPFVATLRELLEMRYLWQQPVRLDNRQLVAALGDEPHTPVDQAMTATLQGLGCLPARHAAPAAAPRTA